jgi:hypothetical protein
VRYVHALTMWLFNRLTRLRLQQVAYAEGVLNSATFDCAAAESQLDVFCVNSDDDAFHFLLNLDYYCDAAQGICSNPTDCCSDYRGMICEFHKIANTGADWAIYSWT